MKNQKCPTCQGELETKQIEKMLKGGGREEGYLVVSQGGLWKGGRDVKRE